MSKLAEGFDESANFENYFLDILQDTNIPGNSSFNSNQLSQSKLLEAA